MPSLHKYIQYMKQVFYELIVAPAKIITNLTGMHKEKVFNVNDKDCVNAFLLKFLVKQTGEDSFSGALTRKFLETLVDTSLLYPVLSVPITICYFYLGLYFISCVEKATTPFLNYFFWHFSYLQNQYIEIFLTYLHLSMKPWEVKNYVNYLSDFPRPFNADYVPVNCIAKVCDFVGSQGDAQLFFYVTSLILGTLGVYVVTSFFKWSYKHYMYRHYSTDILRDKLLQKIKFISEDITIRRSKEEIVQKYKCMRVLDFQLAETPLYDPHDKLKPDRHAWERIYMENKPWGDEWLPEPGQRRTMDRIHSILSRYDQKLPQADLDMLKFKLDCIRKDLYNIVSNFNYYDEPIPLYKKVFNEYAYCLKMVWEYIFSLSPANTCTIIVGMIYVFIWFLIASHRSKKNKKI